MNKLLNKLLSILLAASMIVTFLPAAALAAPGSADIKGLAANTLSSDASLLSVDVSNYIDTVSAVIDEAAGTVTANVVGQDQNIFVTLSSPTATYVIDNTLVGDFVLLNLGENVFPITVTAQDGTVKVYTMTLNRLPSQDATLAYLWVAEEGATSNVQAQIDSANNTISATVTGSIQNISMQPTVMTSTYVLKQNGSAIPASSGIFPVTLAMGDNAFTVEVTADDGVTFKTYALTLTRVVSTSADFTAYIMDPTGGIETSLSFSGNASQGATVSGASHVLFIAPASQTSVAVVRDPGGSVLQAGQSGYALTLATGDNAYTIEMTAEDGTKTSSTLTLTRAASSDTTLASVQASSPVDHMTDFATIDNSLNEITLSAYGASQDLTIRPTVATAAWVLKRNGTAIPSSAGVATVTLDAGANAFTVDVTAEDGSTRTYGMTITRALSTDPTVQTAMLSSPAGTTVTATVNEAAGTVKATVTSANQYINVVSRQRMVAVAVLDASSADVQGGAAVLGKGANLFTIQTTAENGAARTYQFTVTLLQHTVSFDSAAKGGSAVADVYADYNSMIAAPADPTRPGYAFAGWYKDAGLATPWNFATDKVASDITLYSKWTVNSYQVTFDSKGGSAVAGVAADYNTTIAAPADPAKTGYAFAGWYKDAGFAAQWNFATDKVTSSITLHAKWAINRYQVTFDSQGGSAVAGVTADYNATIAAPADPAKAGYAFAGWYKDAGLASQWNFATDKVTSNITLYAKWTINRYQVAFDSQGGSAVTAVAADHNTTIAAPADPAKIGYTFAGWYKDAGFAAQWNFATDKVTSNIILYAKWAPVIPDAPIITVASASYNSIHVSWAAVKDAVGYEVYRAASSAGPWTLVSDTSSASVEVTRLTMNVTYYFMVRAYAVADGNKNFGAYSPVKSDKPILGVPGLFTAAAASYNSIKLTWAAVPGANGYYLYRSTSASGAFTLITTTSALGYTNSVNTGTTCYYRIQAYRNVGATKVTGANSPAVSAKASLAAPASIKAARASATSIKVSWGAVVGATGYGVYRSTSPTGTFTLLKTVTGRSYTNTALKTGKTYYYKVRAYRMVGAVKVYSGYSAVVSAKP